MLYDFILVGSGVCPVQKPSESIQATKLTLRTMVTGVGPFQLLLPAHQTFKRVQEATAKLALLGPI